MSDYVGFGFFIGDEVSWGSGTGGTPALLEGGAGRGNGIDREASKSHSLL